MQQLRSGVEEMEKVPGRWGEAKQKEQLQRKGSPK